jgi:methyl-accepting chemotaxis protein
MLTLRKRITFKAFKAFKAINFNTVKTKLLVSSAIVLLVPSVLIGWLTFNKSQAQIKELFMSSAAVNVDLVNKIITDKMNGNAGEIDALSQKITSGLKQDPSNTSVRNMLQDFAASNPDNSAPFFGTKDGAMVLGSPDQKLPQGYDPRETPWYKDALAQPDRIVITNPYQDAVSGDFVVTLAKAVAGNAGVVGINVTLTELKQLTKDIHIGKNGYIVIYSKNKQFFLHPTTKPGTPTQPHNEQMYQNDSGTYEYLFKGEPKEMIYTTNPPTGWKVAGNMSLSEIKDLAKPILYRTIVVIAAAIVLGGLLITFVILSIVKPLNLLMKGSERISQGDLTGRVQVKSKDELGRVALSFNQMADSLSSILKELSHNANELAAASEELKASSEQTNIASEQIVQTIQDLASGSEKQFHYVEASSQATLEMSTGVQQISSSSNIAASTAQQTSEKAADGYEAIQTVKNQMNSIQRTVSELAHTVKELGEQSRQINLITEMITDISAQTNLLSLNAAIEAARAGEHGRGFAVVAGEVRKLADQSVQSTQKISEVISNIQAETVKAVATMEETVKAVEEGIGIANTAGESFEHIRQSVQAVSEQIKEVTAATRMISESTERVTDTIQIVMEVAQRTASGTQELSASSQEQLAAIEEITAASAKLHEMSERLKSLVNRFKVE